METQETIRTAYRTTMQTHSKSEGRERSISQIPHTSAVHTARITHRLQRIRVYPCQIKKSLTLKNYSYDNRFMDFTNRLLVDSQLCRWSICREALG